MPVIKRDGVTDTGTGAYSGPSEPVTVTETTDVGSTGAVQGPSEPTTYQSDLEEAPGTGAVSGPDGPTTYHEWPDGPGVKMVDQAENKAVKSTAKKTAKSTKK